VEQHRGEVLPRIPGTRIKIIPDRGHLVPIDKPEEFQRQFEHLRSSLEQIESAVSTLQSKELLELTRVTGIAKIATV
jgi:hypothetical protein